MKKMLAVLPLALCASGAFAFDHNDGAVHWKSIVGVITAQGVDNPVGDVAGPHVDSGTFAWSTRGGRAAVNLTTGAASFEVEGLVINGTVFSGTPGPVSAVTGTLVCDAGSNTQTVLDTPAVSLSADGDAEFFGHIGGIPASCTNPLFLIRIATPEGAKGLWIATGAERFSDDNTN